MKTYKAFVEGMLPKTEKGINKAMEKGLDKLNKKYQQEYDNYKYPLDKKVWKSFFVYGSIVWDHFLTVKLRNMITG